MGKSLFIYGPIKAGDSKGLVSQINSEEESLTVHINSPGGSVYDGFSIFNALQSKREILTTYIDGLAFSAASWLALAAKPENRYMSRASQFGIHQAINFAGGNKKDLENQIAQLEKIDEIQTWIYTQNTSISKARIKELMKSESPLSFDEALEFGFKESQPQKIAAYFNIDNMDLFEKMASIFTPEQKESKIIKEEAEKEAEEALKNADTVSQQLESQFAKVSDLQAIEKHLEGFVEAILDKWSKLATKEELDGMIEAKTKVAVSEFAANIKTKGFAPTAEEVIAEAKEGPKEKVYEPLTMPEGISFKDLTKNNQ